MSLNVPKDGVSQLAPSPSAKSMASTGMSMSYDGKSAGAKAGIIIGVFVVFFLLSLLVLWLWKPDAILNEDDTLDNGKYVGWSVLFAILIAGVAMAAVL